MTELECLALRHGTDKSSHGYCLHYEKLIGDFQYFSCTLIEIGIATGDSLRMWREWMPQARIYGIDVNDYENNDPGIVTFIGNQSNPDDLDRILLETGRFHILIDDAGHNRQEQIACYNFMFPKLLVGGWYIIEDMNGLDDLRDFEFHADVEEMHMICARGGSWILFLKKR